VQYCGHVGNPAIDHRNLHRFRPRGHVNDIRIEENYVRACGHACMWEILLLTFAICTGTATAMRQSD